MMGNRHVRFFGGRDAATYALLPDNYALGQRLDWLRRTRCQIDRCSLVSEPIGEIADRVDYYTQQADLKQTQLLYPEYKDIWAESQQVSRQRLKKAWERGMVPDASGRRGGRPRFKKPGEGRLKGLMSTVIKCSQDENTSLFYTTLVRAKKLRHDC